MADGIIVLGVIAGIIYYELTGISPGGIIVPGYIALFLDEPLRIAATLVLSLAALLLVKLLSGHVILYGRRKFAVYIFVGFAIRYAVGSLGGITGIAISAALVIGYLVPGILAQEMERQGIVKTAASMAIVAVLVKLAALLSTGLIKPV